MNANKDELFDLLQRHSESFEDFATEWRDHREEGMTAIRQVGDIHSSFKALAPNLSYLAQLPLITQAIQNLQVGQAGQISRLVDQAGDGEKLRSRAVERMLFIGLVVIMFFGLCLLLVLVRETDKDVKATKEGISITGHDRPIAPPQDDNKKTE